MKLRVNWHGWNGRLLCLLFGASMAVPGWSQSLSEVGRIEPAELAELSGLAVSRVQAGRWWGLNDSGNPSELFALDGAGRSLGRVAIDASNFDWEDIASYRQDGVAYLAIADTGDNFSLRGEVSIWIVAEPAAELPDRLPAREIRFRFTDGPRDCEALAADPARDRFLLIDKGRHPAGLYAVPMHPGPGAVVAQRIADLPSLWPEPVPPASMIGADRVRGSATAMDLSPDGRRLLVLTYRHLLLFERGADEDWPQALQRPMRWLPLPALRIAEAVGWDREAAGALIGGESVHGALLRWDGRMKKLAPTIKP